MSCGRWVALSNVVAIASALCAASCGNAGSGASSKSSASDGGSPLDAAPGCHARSCIGTPEAGATDATYCTTGKISCLPDGTESACTGSCTPCKPGATQCSGNGVLQTCETDGQWGTAAACENQTCVSGACTGVCAPGQKSCDDLQPQTCGTSGQWQNEGAVCSGATAYCADATCTAPPPSCAPGGPGMNDCGAITESCCMSPSVAGGTYYRAYARSGSGPTGKASPATVSRFRLDRYLVTVGRFRQFVIAWNGGTGYTPPASAGKHTHLNGGNGLTVTAGGFEPGWAAADDGNMSPTDVNLECDLGYATWTPSAGSAEHLPINCVNWWEAYAFCIWDGGFLPSESEWEYAAAGGSEQREYPWGATAPGVDNHYAIYGCNYPGGSGTCTGTSNIAPVGTAILGAALWGQLDLPGNLWEWNLDWYAAYVNPCADCANLTPTQSRVFRGGSFYGDSSDLLPPNRYWYSPSNRSFDVGFRCARTP